jgi:uncharacterized protein
MNRYKLAAVSAAACLFVSAANAQVITVTTTPPGSIGHSISTAVAKAIVDHTSMRATVTPQQSHGQEAVNDKSAEISLAIYSDVQQYVTGTGEWAGKGTKPDIRLISRLIPLLSVAYVRADSDIKSIADLKGKRVGSEFPAHPGIRQVVLAQMASAGLTPKDVEGVPTRNIITQADDFAAGKLDAFWMALGSAKVKQVSAAVGGLRALPIDNTPESLAAVNEFVPGAYFSTLRAGQFEELKEEMPVMAYDMVLFTHKDQPDSMIYEIAKAMHENKKSMAEVFAGMNRFDPNRMAAAYKDETVYHPGAIKLFKETKQWPPSAAGGS